MPKLIDDNENEYIPINVASQFIPGRPHRATIWRWCLKGIRRNGATVKLSTVAVGGRRFTTKEFIAAFLRACNGDAPMAVVNDSFQRRAEAAGRTLEAMGVR
jgi:hypothetical protein